MAMAARPVLFSLTLRRVRGRAWGLWPCWLLANTCIESTGRFAIEFGYHVTLVKDATAAFTRAMMHAAHALNGPTFAHAILTTTELLAALPEA